jgi:hypothetical protein
MKGKLEKIGDKWFVRYVRSEGGGSFRLPLHPNFVEMTDFVYIKNERFYDGDEIDFTEALVNPMGRYVDPNDLRQNHSLCKGYARPHLLERGIIIPHKEEDLGYTTKTGIKISDEMVRATMIPKEYFGKKEDSMMVVPMAQYPKDETKKLFTDYPITELGDEEFKEAPIRECELLFYDDNKYCYVKVGGIEKEIKRAYIYTKSGRCGEVDCISIDEINKLIKVNKQKQHLIDMMKGDEELGLYEQIDQNNPVTKGSTALVKEIKLEDVFNDKKKEGAKRVIQQHKVLKELTLINPAHLIMTSDGYGEFPDGYKLTEKGIQYIIEQLNK